jgi:type II secretory pathway component PulF
VSRFRFEAARPDGEVVRGTLTAPHAAAALDEVTARRLLALDVEELPAPRARRLPRRDLAVFFRGLSTLVRAGVPLDRALRTAESGALRDTVIGLREAVRQGKSLSRALGDAPGIPAVAVGLVRAGEDAGLDFALEEAAKQLEREADLAGQLRAALTYPAILLLVGLGTIGVLVLTVLPRFVALLGDSGSTLPTATRLLLDLSAGVRAWWPGLLVGTVVAGALGWRWLTSAAGHEALLHLPGVGPLRLALATARSAKALSALLATGAPALRALEVAAAAAGDLAVGARLRRVMARVRTGGGLAAALTAEQAMDSQVLELAQVGDESGRLPELLGHGAALAESRATRALQQAVKLVEPLLILLMGAMVAFVALALLQAVYGVRVR